MSVEDSSTIALLGASLRQIGAGEVETVGVGAEEEGEGALGMFSLEGSQGQPSVSGIKDGVASRSSEF